VWRLAGEGAQVVKIEPPAGDPLRTLSPRWYRELHEDVTVERLDLKAPDGASRLATLLSTADLLLTSQRPAALARLGITARRLAHRHPRLRWLAIVGDTRDPERPGHDLTYQAQVGLIGADLPRTLLADLLGAERAVATALLLLRRPAPSVARVGLRDALDTAARPLRVGLTGPGGLLGGQLPSYRVYAARTGSVAVAALEPHFRARLYEALGLEDGTDLARVMRTRTARQWERWAAARDLPLARVSRS
jgi:crotonobetainyl-CoA:carnitine CoA-transferase CaiB-like acyl-CoA transferase